MNLLDHLQEQGYDPQEPSGHTGDWYDLIVSGVGTIRVCLGYPDEGYADVYAYGALAAWEWEAHLSPGTPAAAIIAVLEAAERQLADRRGGPVTPAQEATAR